MANRVNTALDNMWRGPFYALFMVLAWATDTRVYQWYWDRSTPDR